MAKPTVYDELYPGRFLKAGLLKGQKVNLTIKDVDLEGLVGDDNKEKLKAIVSFEERPMQLVLCKTNGLCIRAMFGSNLKDWVGKRVMLFEGQWNGEPCIRIWGSPDIQRDQKVEIALPRRKPFTMDLHAIKGAPVASAAGTDPRILAAWELLGWTRKQGAADRAQSSLDDGNYLALLNAQIDQQAVAS